MPYASDNHRTINAALCSYDEGMGTYSRAERNTLADLLLELGPDQPTLCEGWATRDLASHLSTRERGGGSEAGESLASYRATVERWRTGPHGLSPFRLPGFDKRLNFVEHVIHHEDVRRAQPGWAPRNLEADEQDEVWGALAILGRLAFRKVDVGVELRRPDGSSRTYGDEPRVVVTGEPVELVLFASGRGDHAQVEIDGPPDAVAALAAAELSM